MPEITPQNLDEAFEEAYRAWKNPFYRWQIMAALATVAADKATSIKTLQPA